MPNKIQTIKEITDNSHIKWLSKSRTINKGVADEMTVLPYGYLGTAIEEALTSLLDSLEKELPEKLNEEEPLTSEINIAYKRGYNELLEEVINIINSHR